jgi:branched-chain amino acid transport system substrate-binding protein
VVTRREILKVAAGGAVVLVAAKSAYASDKTGVTDDKIRIGILGDLTGHAAHWGSGNLAGGTLAFEEINAAGGINGRKLEWISVDSESSAPKGIAGFKRLVDQEKVFAIFGPTSSAVGVPLLKTMASSSVPIFIPTFSSPLITNPPVKNIFRSGTLNDADQGRVIADYVASISKKRSIAIVRQSDEYGKNGATNVGNRLKEIGNIKISEEQFNASDTDFTSQLLRIRESDADVMVVYGYPAPSAIVMRQAKQLGLPVQIVGSTATASRTYAATVGKEAAGTRSMTTTKYLPEGDDTEIVKFRKAFEARFPELARQTRPEATDQLAYHGAKTLIEGLKRAGRDLSREKLISSLEGLKDFETGIAGATTFGPDRREGNRSGYVLEIKDDLSRTVLPKAYSAI